MGMLALQGPQVVATSSKRVSPGPFQDVLRVFPGFQQRPKPHDDRKP